MAAPDRDEILRQLQEHGYALIPGFPSASQLATINALYGAMLGQHRGRNNFEGSRSERIYTLVARHRQYAVTFSTDGKFLLTRDTPGAHYPPVLKRHNTI
jgi:hypothetical protein